MLTKADIRLVRSLADKRARTDEGLFVAEGGKLIGELRASTLRIRRIYALDGVFAGLDKGQYDMIIAGVSITPERQEAYEMTEPYLSNQLVIVTKKDA